MKKYLTLLLIFSFSILSASNKHFYIIYRTPPGSGFWSNFFVILNGFDVADSHNWIPIVDMERYATLYKEKMPINNTSNAWEYYFEQYQGNSLKKVYKSHYSTNGGNGVFSTASTIKPPPHKITRARELINKYIKIKETIRNEIDSIIPEGIYFNILGVHVRGTDRRQGTHSNHLMTAEANTYLEKAIELDSLYQFSHIFLACDELETVDMFKNTFKERLIVTDAFRVSANVATNINYNWLFNAKRTNHRYLLGKEVLIDALLLARCGHLLCGPSNVSHAAIYFSKGDQEIHEVDPTGMSEGKK